MAGFIFGHGQQMYTNPYWPLVLATTDYEFVPEVQFTLPTISLVLHPVLFADAHSAILEIFIPGIFGNLIFQFLLRLSQKIVSRIGID